MIILRGLHSVAITLVFCLLIQSAQSFFPTTWKEVLFGYGGVSHVEQTETAFAVLAAKYFPTVTGLSKSMIKARDTISQANADVDDNQNESALHCDGENFDVAQVRLQTLHNDVVNYLSSGSPSNARKSLGSALHTVQDFYAHSNWVEMGNTGPSDVLGRASTIPHAGPLDPTCADCLPHNPTDFTTLPICLNCTNNEVGFLSLLTSGYYVGEDVVPVLGIAKCHHGGFSDGSVFKSITIGPTNPGINKDSLYCGWSPHYFLHSKAVAASIGATEQFIDDIKAVITTSQLRQLFGVGPTLGFAMDTTGSMGDIIAAVQDASIQIVTARLGTPDEPSSYIVSPFNDPETGPVTATSDVKIFTSTIQSLGASGGGDCPELSITGMINAASVMDEESILFMFTDAAPKDFDSSSILISLCLKMSIRVYIFKFDSDCDDGISGGSKMKRVDSMSDRVYSEIAVATSGGYNSLPRAAVTNITSLIDTLTLSDSNFILRISDSLPINGSTAYLVPVDSSLTQVTISLSGTGVAMTVNDPVGAPLDPGAVGVTDVELAAGRFIIIKSPKVGSWRVEITGTGNFTLDVTGIGPLHFSSFVFAALAGRPGHEGYFGISGSPPYNSDIGVIAAVDGPWSTARFSFRLPDGTILTTLSMIQGTGAVGDPPMNQFFCQLRLTPVDRYVYVDGMDTAGKYYMRLIPIIISPIYSNGTFPLGNITSPPISSSTKPSSSSSSSASAGASTSTSQIFLPYGGYANPSSAAVSSSNSAAATSTSSAISSSNSASSLPTAASTSPVSTSSSSFTAISASNPATVASRTPASSSTASTSAPHTSTLAGLFSTNSARVAKYSSSTATFSSPTSASTPTLKSSSAASIAATSSSVAVTSASFEKSTSSAVSKSLSTSASSGSATSISSSSSTESTSFPPSPMNTLVPSTSPSSFISSYGLGHLMSVSAASSSKGIIAAASTSATSSTFDTSVGISNKVPYGNGTFATYNSPTISASTTPCPLSTLKPYIGEMAVTVVAITTTIDCPITISSSYSGSMVYSVTKSTSTITTTSTLTIPCKKCKTHVYEPTSVPEFSLLPSASSELPTPTDNLLSPAAPTETESPPLTVTEIIYITTSTCAITIGTSVSSGSTLYILTHSVATKVSTLTTTAPCDTCGPHTVTITSGLIPSAGPPPYVTLGIPPVGPPGYVTLKISSVPPAHTTLSVLSSPLECYGGNCEITLSPSLAPPSLPAYSPPPSYPTFFASPSIVAVSSVPECYGPECAGIPSSPTSHPTGPGCKDPGCPGAPSSTPVLPVSIIPSVPVAPSGPSCSGTGCRVIVPPIVATIGVLAPPANGTVTGPRASPSIISYTGGVDKSSTLVVTNVVLGLIITTVAGIISL